MKLSTGMEARLPELYIDFFRELDNLRPGPNGLDPEEVAAVMARYATEVVRPAT